VLSAAGFAHERGFVHRDLKPMNVLIDRSGRVRVTDFGIARAGGSEITRTGSVLGTAQYLSPEQAQGFDVTQSSDLYSIGVMLFEMLTGRVPFDGDNAVAIAMKQVSEQPPPPSALNPSVPPALDSVVMRALAKDPANRYSSAEEMLTALDAAEANPQMAGHTERFDAFVPPPEDDDSDWKKWALAAAAILLVGFLIWFFFLRGDDGVRVPGVEGDSVTAATLELQRAGFEVDVERIESDVVKDTVIEQDPRGGDRAEEGSTVNLTVSLGPAPSAIPDVVGLREDQATKKLEKAGFEVSVEQDSSDDVQRGRVIETSPSPGFEAAAGETVTITVSTGSDLVTIPSVVGLDRFEASNQLENAGFIVDVDGQENEAPEDQVISQSPTGSAAEGSRIRIVYSLGPGDVSVPNVIGKKQDGAERTIQGAGLNVNTEFVDTDVESEDGRVISQSPSSGSVPPDSTVTITVGQYVEPEPDPTDPEVP
jgi:beta-lactam-binding protein with PASTA domain